MGVGVVLDSTGRRSGTEPLIEVVAFRVLPVLLPRSCTSRVATFCGDLGIVSRPTIGRACTTAS